MRPDVETFLTYLNRLPGPRAWQVTAPEARAMTLAMRGVADLPVGALAVIRDVAGGPVPLRLFDARPERTAGPVLVFFHGGGWVLGDLDTYAPICAEMARVLDVPVVSVDYRLAPEHPWPAAPDDCEAAARWIAQVPAALGLTPTALLLAGDSAGGNLALVTAAALRDAPAALPVAAQWAIYPATDLAGHYPSYDAFRQGFFLDREQLRWFFDAYAADPADSRASPLAGPLDGLPPTLVTTAGLDPIRDGGRAYAAALAEAGVPVTYREAAGIIHGYLNLRKLIPSGQADFAAHLALCNALIAETCG